ncbi:MAG: hypothetical protein OXC72_13830 [Roseovarius sp.]|nr:hypothetical protein [Roseovarius sp.]
MQAPFPPHDEICKTLRPSWDGLPIGIWVEAVSLSMTPGAIALFAATAIAAKLRNQWAGLAVCVGWCILVSIIAFYDPYGGLKSAAMEIGCVGRPTGFIMLIGLLCAALAIYTASGTSESRNAD